MSQFIKITDQYTYLFSLCICNKVLIYCLGIGQLIVAAFSLAQHFVSVIQFGKIFKCSFNGSTNGSNDAGKKFLSHDMIIFDFGLFHELIKVEECVANYLDGGYMRCLWCIGQMVALSAALFSMLFIPKAHPIYLWPLLIVQNAYCFGLVILTIATSDKLLTSLLHPANGHLILLIVIFFIGTSANYLFDYILWHYYWYQETEYIKRTGSPVVPFWV
ncbi:Uncharacterized protein BM_BM4798 [Brugia malayi]|uniref:Polyprenol reductase n=1 Tax=Brugia malayi TaxID=6279 RepID=A0A4E9F5J0_BRUMA|nr:Uncharacterized protein BM_BM4798 [Brugia malayi]VIO92025.1 Uncharacterized protein BM_BM4798 [Brugia malayi]